MMGSFSSKSFVLTLSQGDFSRHWIKSTFGFSSNFAMLYHFVVERLTFIFPACNIFRNIIRKQGSPISPGMSFPKTLKHTLTSTHTAGRPCSTQEATDRFTLTGRIKDASTVTTGRVLEDHTLCQERPCVYYLHKLERF